MPLKPWIYLNFQKKKKSEIREEVTSFIDMTQKPILSPARVNWLASLMLISKSGLKVLTSEVCIHSRLQR